MSSEIISVEPFPSYRQEVERKAWETFHHLMHKHKLGEITDTQYKMGLDTLQMAYAGIIGFDFMPLLGQASMEIKGGASEVELFYRPYIDNSLVITVRKPSLAQVEVITIDMTEPAVVRTKHFNDADKPGDAATQYANKFKAKVLQSGFELF